MRWWLAVVLVASLAHADDLDPIRSAVPTCDPARAHCLGIQLHIAQSEHGFVQSPEWIAAQVAAANRHFARLDIGFQLAGVDTLPATAVHVETRADRDALAADR